jgi:hypothetical protein
MSAQVDELVDWFLATFASRTPPRSVLDGPPLYRVGWHEIRAKMQELELHTNAVDDRLWWQEVYDTRLRRQCNKLLREAGEKPLGRRGGVR